MRAPIAAFIVPVVAALTSHAAAGSYDDLPSIAAAFNPDPAERSQLQVECKLRSDGKADCVHTQAMIRVPDPQKIEAEIVEREKDMTAAVKSPKWSDFCKKLDAEIAAAEKANASSAKPLFVPGDKKAFEAKQLSKLCQSKDMKAYLDAMADFDRRITAKTCSIMINTFSATYTKLDEDTWTSTETALSTFGCNATRVNTLWRPPKKKGEKLDIRFWSAKQVRSVPPNADPKMCPTNSTVEHRWDGESLKKLDCVYFKT
jgi:hypothetical protein